MVCNRYNACILGGAANNSRSDISNDIVNAILKTRADKHNPAVYWSKEEQVKRLDNAFKKWAALGSWNAAAAKVRLCIPPSMVNHSMYGLDTPRADEARTEGLPNAPPKRRRL